MTGSASAKSARLDAPITAELQERLRLVANRQGRSLDDYVINVLEEAVSRDTTEPDVIALSRAASEQFAAVLIDPPEVASALRNAFAYHRRLVRPA
jgi:uncharacterized protein (DUF1778 family)